MLSVFFSYSHRDEDFRNELETHLAPLKRQGVVDTWHDRRINPGEEFDSAISDALERSNIILLLVSPYFIESNYCYELEMTRALERHQAGDAVVIPVILRPCDWRPMPFGKLLAVPQDGKPITKFSDPHEGYLQVAQAIRQASEQLSTRQGRVATTDTRIAQSPLFSTQPQIRSSNLRLKRKFSDQERDQFIEDSFEYIARFFDGSMTELQARNPGIDSKFRRIDANHFTATVYREGTKLSECKIWLSSGNFLDGNILFSHTISSGDNSWNESVSITDDGYTLSLKPMGLQHRRGELSNLSPEGASEYFWELFIERLQ